jgi:hypothetical protein
MYFEIANIFTIIFLCCCHVIENVISMPANGTAVEGVCVTRRNPPVDCPGCEQGFVPVGRQVWRNFCDHGEPMELN